MTGHELAVRTGRTGAAFGRGVAATVRLLVPVLVALLVLGGRVARRTAVLVFSVLRARFEQRSAAVAVPARR